MHRAAALALALLVATAALPGAAGATASTPAGAPPVQSNQSDAYAGAHVSFEASGGALTDYSVGGDVVLANVSVAPQSETSAGVGVDVGLSAVTDVAGVDLSVDASSSTRAEIGTESSASLTAHDTERGILTVDAGGEAHYVEVDLGADGSASDEGERRVVVRSGDRTGAFVVAGDGQVTVNDQGDVTADLGEDATLVFRSYDGERDEDDEEQERMIAEGTATAEVYAEERDGEVVADAATYAEDLAVDVRSEGQERVEMTVDRAESEGTVVVATVSEAAVGAVESAEDVSVTIDGEAAAEASSYSELEGGIGEEPRYVVRQSGEASASADVLVAVDHFSERQVTVEGDDSGDDGTADDSSDDGTADDGSGDGTSDDAETPGFGLVAALAALLGVVARVARS